MTRPDYRQIQELYHYGIPKRSGRYPYGSGDRPYQDKEGLGKKLFKKVAKDSAKSGAKKLLKDRKEKKKVLRKGGMSDEATERQKHIANKSKVLQSGSAREVMAYKGELTNQEYQQVLTRLNYEQQLNSYAQKEVKSNLDKIDGMMKNLKMFNEWATIGTDVYNSMASVYNATSEGKKKPLTMVEKPQGKEKKKKGKD